MFRSPGCRMLGHRTATRAVEENARHACGQPGRVVSSCLHPVYCNDAQPESVAGVVCLQHMDDPSNRKSVPEKQGGPTPQAASTAPTHDENLCHIEALRIVRAWCTTRDQRKARNPDSAAYEKGKPALRRRPIQRESLVVEASIGPRSKANASLKIVSV
jgi:hypothetical protein